MSYAIDHGYTNAKSEETILKKWHTSTIPLEMKEIHDYIKKNPADEQAIEDAYYYMHWSWNNWKRFPDNLINDKWFMFIVDGYKQRAWIYNNIVQASELLDIDYKLVLSSIMGEQVRIASKGVRWDLKSTITTMSPRFLVSYNISLWVGWIKQSTAQSIEHDAKKYWYGDIQRNPSEKALTTSDYYQAIYPTYLVKNILTRREKAGFDISHNPWVVGTIYNIGNNTNKKPHATPQIWGAIINIWWTQHTYWAISMMIYRYLKIYK